MSVSKAICLYQGKQNKQKQKDCFKRFNQEILPFNSNSIGAREKYYRTKQVSCNFDPLNLKHETLIYIYCVLYSPFYR